MGTLASKLDARSVFMESRPSWRHNSACSQRAVSLYSLWHSGDREWLGGDRPGRIEMFERMFWVTGDTGDGWEKKIPVVDPDPVGFCLCFVSSTLGTTTSTLCQAPMIWTVLDGWAANSPVGLQTECQCFDRTHMAEMDHILEVLLRDFVSCMANVLAPSRRLHPQFQRLVLPAPWPPFAQAPDSPWSAGDACLSCSACAVQCA